MDHKRLTIISVAFGLAAFLVACGQNTTLTYPGVGSPPGGSPPRGSAPTIEPDTVAVACFHLWVYEFGPDKHEVLQKYHYDNRYFDIKSVAWDRSGNLYVGVNSLTDSWVDVYKPGEKTWSYRIKDGVHNPGFLAVDPSGNLYVGNVGILGRSVSIYAPGNTKPGVRIPDVGNIGGMDIGQNYLWIGSYPFIGKNSLLNYDLFSKTLRWVLDDDKKPGNIVISGDKLFMVNYDSDRDHAGVDEYDISGAPKYVRGVGDGDPFIYSVAIDSRGNVVYASGHVRFGEVTPHGLYIYHRDGDELYYNNTFAATVVATDSRERIYDGYNKSAEINLEQEEYYVHYGHWRIRLNGIWTGKLEPGCHPVAIAIMR